MVNFLGVSTTKSYISEADSSVPTTYPMDDDECDEVQLRTTYQALRWRLRRPKTEGTSSLETHQWFYTASWEINWTL